MSEGTNKERIEQNNLILAQNNAEILKAINKANDLPEYQDIESVYSKTKFYTKSVDIGSYSNYAVTNGKILIVTKGTTIYCYYDGELRCTYDNATGGIQNNIVKITDSYCIFIMNKTTSSSDKNYATYKFDFKENTCIKIGDIALPQYNGIKCYKNIVANGAKIYVYNEETNTLGNIIGENAYLISDWVSPYICYGSANSSASSHNFFKIIYDESTDTYTCIKKNLATTFHGVNFFGNKAFMNGNIYELSSDMTVGNLIKSSAYTPSNKIKCINDIYYIIGSYLYTFDEETNTFTRVSSVSSISANVTGYNNDVYTQSSTNRISYIFEDSDKLIAFNTGNSYAFVSNYPMTKSSDMKIGKEAYNISGEHLVGSMPDNGALSYTPSTSQQNIPAGYTSGGTIAAVDNTIDANIIPENIKSGVTILGITGTYEGESE